MAEKLRSMTSRTIPGISSVAAAAIAAAVAIHAVPSGAQFSSGADALFTSPNGGPAPQRFGVAD